MFLRWLLHVLCVASDQEGDLEDFEWGLYKPKYQSKMTVMAL